MKTWYLVRITGSMGSIYDWSTAKVMEREDIDKELEEFVASNPHFKYAYFDKRIGFHVWHILADFQGYKQQHVMWVYSTSEKRPELASCNEMDM